MTEPGAPAEQPRSPMPSWVPWLVLAAVGAAGTVAASSRGPAVAPASARSAAAASTNELAVSATAPAVAPADSAATVWYSAEHLIVSHRDTKLGARHEISRSREEARVRAEEARSRALKGEDFSKLVREYSDDPTLSRTNGVLLSFRYKDATKPFADAVVAVEPGQIAAIAETDLGFHVIKRLTYKPHQ
jgi:hypothetical protein